MPDPLIDSFKKILQSTPVAQGQPSLIPGIMAGLTGEVPNVNLQPKNQSAFLPSSTPSVQTGRSGQTQDRSFKFNPEILKLLIPAITAGVGTAFPGTLPGAAGFQTGFVGEVTRKSDREEDRQDKNIEKTEAEEEEKRKEIRTRAEKIAQIASESLNDPNEILRDIEIIERRLGMPPQKSTEQITQEVQSILGLPEGVTEADINFTMKKHNLTREQVLERLSK